MVILRTYYMYLQFSIITLGLILLTGCSTRVKSEKDIIADLQASEEFISDTVEISNYEIIKRQTNTDDKTDLIYLTVCTDEPQLTCDLSYTMQYILYNDGWKLESVERYTDGDWMIEGLAEETIIKDSTASDPFFYTWDLSVTDYALTDMGYYYEDGYYEKWIELDLTATGDGFSYNALYYTSYNIAENQWNLEESYVESSHYSPTYSPDLSASDAIMDALVVGDEPYDSYEYLRTDTDWDNCLEVRYYTAKKSWEVGTETYLISIPLRFSLENEEDTSRWTYSSNNIEVKLQNIDFDLDGTMWGRSGTGYYPDYADVDLEIEQIMSTDDIEEYIAIVSCKASDRYTYCNTEGLTSARFVYGKPGDYYLYIESPSGESAYPWMGTFAFNYSSFHQEYNRGVFWLNTKHSSISNGVKLYKI